MKIDALIDYCVKQIVAQEKRPLVVGVVGDSGSGKSHFANLIAGQLAAQNVDTAQINHDEFLLPRSHRGPLKEATYQDGEFAGKTHWEILENWFRLDEYEKVLTSLALKQTATFYPYERSTGNLRREERVIEPADVLLVDTSMHVERMDFTILVDVDIDQIIQRKLLRDSDLRKPSEIIEMQHNVQSYHWDRTRPKTADIIIDNSDLREPLIIYPLGEVREKVRLPKQHYKAALFDLDGTIINNTPFNFYSWMEFARRHGLELDRERFINELAGLQTTAVISRLFQTELSTFEMEKLYEERHKIYWDEIEQHLHLVRGFEHLVAELKAHNIKVGLVTSASKGGRNRTLRQLGIERLFDVVIGAEHIKYPKPDPQSYQIAMDKLEIASSDVVVFEDSAAGVMSAKESGATVVGILTSHMPEQLGDADILINHYDEIDLNLGSNI